MSLSFYVSPFMSKKSPSPKEILLICGTILVSKEHWFLLMLRNLYPSNFVIWMVLGHWVTASESNSPFITDTICLSCLFQSLSLSLPLFLYLFLVIFRTLFNTESSWSQCSQKTQFTGLENHWLLNLQILWKPAVDDYTCLLQNHVSTLLLSLF